MLVLRLPILGKSCRGGSKDTSQAVNISNTRHRSTYYLLKYIVLLLVSTFLTSILRNMVFEPVLNKLSIQDELFFPTKEQPPDSDSPYLKVLSNKFSICYHF